MNLCCWSLISAVTQTHNILAQSSLLLRGRSSIQLVSVAATRWGGVSWAGLVAASAGQHIDMVTLIPRLPLSAKSCAILVSNTRQSLFIMADCTPSWMLRGVASHVRRRRCPFNSSLKGKTINKCTVSLSYCQYFIMFSAFEVLQYACYDLLLERTRVRYLFQSFGICAFTCKGF